MTASNILAGLMFLCGSAFGQPAFDVISIKPSPLGVTAIVSPVSNGVFHAANVTLRTLIRTAYRIGDFQISGGPSWLDTERFNIDARSQAAASNEETRLMIQSLLAERFKLGFRNESRKMPALALVLVSAGKGQDLIQSDSSTCLLEPGPNNPCAHLRGGPGGLIIGEKLSMTQFAEALGSMFRRRVIDRTGLNGVYDLKFTLEDPGSSRSDASLPLPIDEIDGMTAVIVQLQKHLGLRLERTEWLAEMFVVERVEKPSAN